MLQGEEHLVYQNQMIMVMEVIPLVVEAIPNPLVVEAIANPQRVRTHWWWRLFSTHWILSPIIAREDLKMAIYMLIATILRHV
jgi:hypothetical protein